MIPLDLPIYLVSERVSTPPIPWHQPFFLAFIYRQIESNGDWLKDLKSNKEQTPVFPFCFFLFPRVCFLAWSLKLREIWGKEELHAAIKRKWREVHGVHLRISGSSPSFRNMVIKIGGLSQNKLVSPFFSSFFEQKLLSLTFPDSFTISGIRQ